MYYKGLSWKYKLFLMVSALLISLFLLYLTYTEHGYLPSYAIMGVSCSFIVICLLIFLCDRSLQKYFMKKEDSSDKDDKQ